MGRWDDKTTFKFVAAYLKHECLWNTNSDLYKNKALKADAIYDLDQTMGIRDFHEKQIKIKIKSIRSTYCQELKKIKESELSGTSPYIYVPTLKWFSMLHKCLNNLKPESTAVANENNLKTEDVLAWEFPDEITETEVEIKSKLIERQAVKRKHHGDDKTTLKLNNIKDASTNSLREDEFDMFGKLIATQLKSLPLMLALEAEENIQSLMTKIRRKHLKRTSTTNYASDESS